MFYQVLRIFQKNGSWNQSVQYFFASDYDNTDALMKAVQARYHNILAADLQAADVTYNAAYIIDNAGATLEKAVFDNREAAE